MRSWMILLAGLILWAVHFFILYGIGEFSGSTEGARIAIVILTLACLILLALLSRLLYRQPRGDAFGQWRRQLGLAVMLLSGIAIIWQALPAGLAH